MEKSGLVISPATSNPLHSTTISHLKDVRFLCKTTNFRDLPPGRFRFSTDKVKCPSRTSPSRGAWSTKCTLSSLVGVANTTSIELAAPVTTILGNPWYAHGFPQFLKIEIRESSLEFMQKLVLLDLDPGTAKLAITFLGPFLSAFGFLFVVRIVMSWYPKLPVEKFPYAIAYAPTEPILVPTRKLIPPVGGVDVTPVVWFGLISFLNEILVGPQGLLVLLSQQVV